MHGTNKTGGKFTIKATVVSEDTPVDNSTEPAETGGNESDETEPINPTDPTSTEPGENPHNHVVQTINESSATYFTKGYTGDGVCSECGEVIKTGTSTPELKLNTPKATIKGGKKKITVKYKKVTDATGFQVKYKFGKKSVTKTYNTKKNVTKFIKNLKKGTYKVYVRAFIKQGKNKAYSSWSKAKKVKVK